MQLLTVRVSPMLFRMPPPWPLLIVRPLRVTCGVLLLLSSNTREVLLPLIVNSAAPGPVMVRLFLISSSPLVSLIVWVVWPEGGGGRTKSMVSPLLATVISARKEPAPRSKRLVTVRVLGIQRLSSTSSVGRMVGRRQGD